MTSDAMSDIIRRGAGATRPSRRWQAADTDDHDLGDHITPDADQGRRSTAVSPPISMLISDRIRRAAGIHVRPGHRPVPEVGD